MADKWPGTDVDQYPGTDVPAATEDSPRGFMGQARRGIAGMGVAARDIGHAIAPGTIAAPTQEQRDYVRQGPTTFVEGLGRGLPEGLPAAALPEIGIRSLLTRAPGMAASSVPRLAEGFVGGAGASALQPTETGDPADIGLQSLKGGVLGFGLSAIGAGPQREAMRAAGIRLTPGRQIPLIGREWERFASRLPVYNQMIAYARGKSLEDFEQALYRDALAPIGGGVIRGTGTEAMNQLEGTVGGRMNQALQGASLSTTNQFWTDLQALDNVAARESSDTVRRYRRIIAEDMRDPLTTARGVVGGDRLSAMVAQLGAESRRYASSAARPNGNPQDATLSRLLQRAQNILLDNASYPGGVAGRQQLDAARQAYARYMTLFRASAGARAPGRIDPDGLLRALQRENPRALATGRMRQQEFAEQARGLVPSLAELHPEISPWLTGEGLAGTGVAGHFNPEATAVGAAALSAPATFYNPAGMWTLDALARNASRASRVAPAASPVVEGIFSDDDRR